MGRQVSIEDLKLKLRARGLNPEPYIKILLQFQELLKQMKTHDQLEVAAKVLKTMSIALVIKHAKHHKSGGSDERTSSPFN